MAARTLSPFSGDHYGYGWLIDTVRGHPVRYARGYGGQLVHVTPDLGLTVVITSDPTRPARSGGYFGRAVCPFRKGRFILNACFNSRTIK